MATDWTLPSAEQMDLFLMLNLEQRGQFLDELPASRRIAYAVAYAKRDGCTPSQACSRLDMWRRVYLASREVSHE